MAEAPVASALVGARLGRYEVQEAIGEGAAFVAYRARAFGVEGFIRDVALKVPKPSISSGQVATIVTAARRAISLSHATILQLVDLGRASLGSHTPEHDVTYFVTELSRGHDLRALARGLAARGARAPLGAVLQIGAEIARALEYAHRRRDELGAFEHGALHGGQVFVTIDGQVKVGDFGIAAATHAPLDDLRALGSTLAALREHLEPSVAPATSRRFSDLLVDLETERAGDIAKVHERMLELAFEAAPVSDERDPGALVTRAFEAEPARPLDIEGSVSISPRPPSIEPRPTESLVIASLGPSLAAVDGADVASSVPGIEMRALGVGGSDALDERRAATVALSLARASSSTGAGRGAVLLAAAPVAVGSDGAVRASEATEAIARTCVELAGTTPGRVRACASPAIVARVRGAFVLEEAPGGACWIVSERDASAGYGRFVGRGAELRALGLAVQQAAEEGATMLSLHGPAGIGKTRLVRELGRRLPQDRVAFVYVDCSEAASHVLLGAIGILLRRMLGLDARATLEAAEVVPLLRAMGLDTAEVASLTRTLGVPFESDRRPPAAHEALASFLAKARGDRPIAVILDDADKLDPASSSVLSTLIASERGKELPVLFVCVERTAAGASEGGGRWMSLGLEELDDDAVAQLLASRLGARMIPPDLFELCVEHGGGHPQMLEDLVRELVEAALVRVRTGVASLASNPAEGFFDAPRASASARVARLEQDFRGVLASAAVIGPGASALEIARVIEMSEDRAREALEALEGRGFGRRSEDGGFFAAKAYLQAALDPLEPERRAALHARAAEIHVERARHEHDGAAAADAWVRAAEQLDAAASLRDAARARLEAAGLLEHVGSIEAAAGLFSRALSEIDRPELARRALEALVRIASVADLKNADIEEGLGHALTLADTILSAEERLDVRLRAARSFGLQGLVEIAEVLFSQAETGESRRAVDRARLAVGAATGEPGIAKTALETLAPSAEREAAVALDAAEVAIALDDEDRAGEWLVVADGACVDEGDRARLDLLRGELASARGIADASRHFEAALTAAKRAGLLGVAARGALGLAAYAQAERRFALVTEAAELAAETRDPHLHELAAAWIDRVEGRGIERRIERARAEGREALERRLVAVARSTAASSS